MPTREADGVAGTARGQLSLTVVEAAIATLLILAVTASFAFTPSPPSESTLDSEAANAAALLTTVPNDGTGTVLGSACSSEAELDSREDQLRSILASSLPDGAFVYLQTPVGTVGTPPPDSARVGTAPVVVPECSATLEVWYP
ncbi:hypothetical protein ACFQJC_13350 [Haloferax namakaokahaiae]|uniref:Uncharacterized protein n=1 Tax=Haloferax namakaokahaiae TaxID=1748331 RepID=A0ABD5ZHJ8_9EURY